jgi:hypothetical protein
MNQTMDEKSGSSGAAPSPEGKPKLPASAFLMCGWPLLLVAIGGAIGGGLGGAAFGINIAIYKSRLPVPAKVVLNILVGLSAIGIWFAIAMAIESGRK